MSVCLIYSQMFIKFNYWAFVWLLLLSDRSFWPLRYGYTLCLLVKSIQNWKFNSNAHNNSSICRNCNLLIWPLNFPLYSDKNDEVILRCFGVSLKFIVSHLWFGLEQLGNRYSVSSLKQSYIVDPGFLFGFLKRSSSSLLLLLPSLDQRPLCPVYFIELITSSFNVFRFVIKDIQQILNQMPFCVG